MRCANIDYNHNNTLEEENTKLAPLGIKKWKVQQVYKT